jgi:nucleoside-diphosphate-sugar epimerase
MGGDHVLPELIRKLKKSNKLLKIVGDGNDSRSFIFISDAVNAIIKVANKGAQNQIYNIGSNDEYKIIEIVKILCKILNKKIKIKKGPRHLGSVSRRLPDIKKLKKLNHKNKVNFIKGLRETINYYYFDEKQS